MTLDELNNLLAEHRKAYYSYLEAESARHVAIRECEEKYRAWLALKEQLEGAAGEPLAQTCR